LAFTERSFNENERRAEDNGVDEPEEQDEE
jgi:hypothetical protein